VAKIAGTRKNITHHDPGPDLDNENKPAETGAQHPAHARKVPLLLKTEKSDMILSSWISE
jgi:hypothetical protein